LNGLVLPEFFSGKTYRFAGFQAEKDSVSVRGKTGQKIPQNFFRKKII